VVTPFAVELAVERPKSSAFISNYLSGYQIEKNLPQVIEQKLKQLQTEQGETYAPAIS
jgi:hypothetical protein